MNRYEAAIIACVRQGVAERLTLDQLKAPLIDQLAVAIVGAARASGARVEDVLEIVRHDLDQRTAHHVDQIRPRR
jgi:hypothetical protein